jgi:3-methylcrotonyl-CoA carboxylase alpha subunit
VIRPRMFKRILIANRGEIAVRVIRTCREMGVETVAVYSDADRHAAHVAAADRAVRLGPGPAGESYLRADTIVDAARDTDAEAIHPGYGFLAENSAFAAACADAGLVFIGPPPEAIAQMGSKIEARRLMVAAGLPVVPGEAPSEQTPAAIAGAITRIGFPALIKPSAGGGGIGMRVVRGPSEIDAAVDAARRDAEAAFGDGTLYAERLVERPRHVEIQVFADDQDHVVHLFERECSLQRRHQKVVEESPSPGISPELRERMGAAAIEAARAVGYRNAGTVEFLVDEQGRDFYFLEMNTRLQVEHPVTEMVTGLDLVRAQLVVAAGQALPWRADRLAVRGHAIECRIYAEDPEQEFLPQAGTVELLRLPGGPGVRVDTGIREGDEVPVHYDPLLAKLVVGAETRRAALARAERALSEFVVLGIRSNIGFLRRILSHPEVRAGRLHTALIDQGMDDLRRAALDDDTILAAVAGMAVARRPMPVSDNAAFRAAPDPWSATAGWRP